MTNTPTMTDQAALHRNRTRATEDALFLHHAAADEIQDRLNVVKKSFSDAIIVTGFPAIWSARFPDFRVIADDELLALEPQSADLVIHAMALHWSNDPVGQMIQCCRALRPDGLFLAAKFGGQTLHELRACLGQAEVAVSGGLSPRVAPMTELRDSGGLLQRAGLALPVADALPLRVAYRDLWHLMHDLRAMGEANALNDRLRRPTGKSLFDHAARLYETHFPEADSKIIATFELIFLTGWAPDQSQPKPLRPGSAQHRLADALQVNETKLRD